MRLLHVYSGNLFGGVERLLVTLAATPAGAGLEHHVALCYEGRLNDELRGAGATVHMLAAARLSAPVVTWRARRALRRAIDCTAPDVIVCHGPWSLALFGGVARQRRVPLALWQHGPAGSTVTDRMAARHEPDVIICNSRYTASTLGNRYPRTQRQIIFNPVERPRPHEASANRADVRRELGVPPNTVLITHVSRMESWKGHTALLEALAKLTDVPNWRLVFVGGPQREKEQRHFDTVRRTARTLGIAHRVACLGERRDVASVLMASDVYCQPNLSPEPFGIALVEALWMRLPVVATAQGGPADIVDDTCGILVPPNDPDALASALRRLCEDGACRAAMSNGAPARAATLCDPAGRMADLRAVLEPLC